MGKETSGRLFLPILVAVLGSAISILLWYLVKHDMGPYELSHPRPESYHPWLVLFFGLGVSILIAITVNMTLIAKDRAKTLNKINEDLKKEIGERINAEQTKQKLEVALLQGQKLQAIGTLAGGIAHDFNNLLYAIIGYTELAQADVAKDSLVFQNLGKVLEAAHRGQELISRILAFSRRQHHDIEPLDVRKTIEAALALLRPTIPASVSIIFEPTANMTILGNQTQLHQVLVNLINNSVDAMDGEGTITITMDIVLKGAPLLNQFPDILPQNYCKIEITDTGHGMDQATMERIFEPFYTTKEVGKGTGLGLSIVHSILKEHHGEITVTSQLGHGTTFMILLPEHIAE